MLCGGRQRPNPPAFRSRLPNRVTQDAVTGISSRHKQRGLFYDGLNENRKGSVLRRHYLTANDHLRGGRRIQQSHNNPCRRNHIHRGIITVAIRSR